MVGEGNRIRSPRLMRLFIAIAVVLLIATVASSLVLRKPVLVDRTDSVPASLHLDDETVLDSPLDPVLVVAREALTHMQTSVYDYTATFEKQERIDGKLLDPQKMEMKILCGEKTGDSVKQIPLHAYLRVIEPSKSAGREIIWVLGRNSNKLVAHEAGFMNLMRVQLDPSGSLAMSGNKHPINEIGIEHLLVKLIERGELARHIKDCSVKIQPDYVWEGSAYTRILVTAPTKSHLIDFHQAEILFDPELKLPVSYSAFLWPTTTGDELPLEERYLYRNLKVNVGLTEKDFDPDNSSYNFP